MYAKRPGLLLQAPSGTLSSLNALPLHDLNADTPTRLPSGADTPTRRSFLPRPVPLPSR
jgi:hypothetical protein